MTIHFDEVNITHWWIKAMCENTFRNIDKRHCRIRYQSIKLKCENQS